MSKELQALIYGIIFGLALIGFGGFLVGTFWLAGAVVLAVDVVLIVIVRFYEDWVKENEQR